VPLVEEVTYEEAELTVTVPVKTPSRYSLARFLRRLLLLSALGAGAAAAVHHREAIAGEVKKRVAQLQAMRPKAPREVSAEDSPAPVEQPAAAATVEAPAQPAAVPGAAL
jgi:Tfp pilus assembly protein PilP